MEKRAVRTAAVVIGAAAAIASTVVLFKGVFGLLVAASLILGVEVGYMATRKTVILFGVGAVLLLASVWTGQIFWIGRAIVAILLLAIAAVAMRGRPPATP